MQSEEVRTLESKIDETNSKMDRLIETMTTFVAFQARAEERHENEKDFKKETRRDISKLQEVVATCVTQEEFKPVLADTQFNTRVVAIIGVISSLIIGALAMRYFGG